MVERSKVIKSFGKIAIFRNTEVSVCTLRITSSIKFPATYNVATTMRFSG